MGKWWFLSGFCDHQVFTDSASQYRLLSHCLLSIFFMYVFVLGNIVHCTVVPIRHIKLRLNLRERYIVRERKTDEGKEERGGKTQREMEKREREGERERDNYCNYPDDMVLELGQERRKENRENVWGRNNTHTHIYLHKEKECTLIPICLGCLSCVNDE